MATVTSVLLSEDLMAEGEPEQEFHKGIAERMPRKRIAAGALIRNPDGEILMLEPRYKPTWDIPGGVLEDNESPLDGCRREIVEELGITLPIDRLLVIDWIPRHGVWHDSLQFVFDGGIMTPELLNEVHLQDEEAKSMRFVTLAEAEAHLKPSAYRRFCAAADALTDDVPAPLYLEFGRRVLP